MTPAEARALIAEGRQHVAAMADPVRPWSIAWMRANLARLLDGYAEALEEIERLRPVVDASREMRRHHEGCVTEPPCGECFRCVFDRAVDAYRTTPITGEGGQIS